MKQSKSYTYRQIWQIAFPILVSTLMEQLIGMTDTAFLGRVGEIELGASALGGIFYVAVFMLGLGFSIGAQILIGRRNGEGAYREVGGIFYHGIAFLFLSAAFLFILTRSFSPWLLNRIISSSEVCAAARQYLDWRIYGFFFAFAGSMFRAFYVGTMQTRTLTLNSVTMVLSNILFNYALIFGHFGLPALGIAGAAIGSSLAECVSVVFFVVYTRWRVDFRRYNLHVLPRFRFGMLRRVLAVSVWVMVQSFFSLSTWFLFFLAVEHLGERELAVTNMIRNISSFSFMTVLALASTVSTLTSNLIGQGDARAVMPMIGRTVRLGFFILGPLMCLVCLFPDVVLRIYTDNRQLVDAAHAPLFVLASSYFFTVPAQIYLHAVSGSGNTRAAMWLEMFSLTVYTVYVIVAIFICRVSLAACWTSEYVYNVLILTLSYMYMRSGRWQGRRI